MSEEKRKPVSFRLNPETIEDLKKMAKEGNTSQGRVIDNVIKTTKESKDGKHPKRIDN